MSAGLTEVVYIIATNLALFAKALATIVKDNGSKQQKDTKKRKSTNCKREEYLCKLIHCSIRETKMKTKRMSRFLMSSTHTIVTLCQIHVIKIPSQMLS